MSKILLFAESPKKGEKLAEALAKSGKFTKKGSGVMEIPELFDGSGPATMVSAVGHVLDQQKPKECIPGYSYSFASLPFTPSVIPLTPIADKQDYLNVLEKHIKDDSYSEIVFIGDAAREGLAIFYRILSYTLSQEDIGRKKITIVWKSNEQAETVRNSFTRRIPQTGRLSTGESITGLTASAMSRAVADWMVGMNLSQLFTLRNKAIAQYSEKNGTVSLLTKDDKFSIGRVMTPTLKFIYLRDKAINEFISKEFYQIASNYEAGFTGMRFVGNVSENRFWDKAAAQSIMQKLDGQKVGKVEDVAAKVNSKNAPIGFHSSGFNGLMAKKLAIPVTESAAIIDAIYNDDLLSYPRVDSKHMTEEEFKELRNSFIRLMTNVDFIKGLPKEICDGMIEANDGNFTPKIPIADDSKIIEAHGCLHPVLPAGREKDILAMLNGKDKRAVAYTEIFKNSLGWFLPPSETNQVDVVIDISGEKFSSTGRSVKSVGWKVLFSNGGFDDEDDEKDKMERLPNLTIGDSIEVKSIEIKTGATKPPAKLTSATLAAYMEKPKSFLSNKDELSKEEKEEYAIFEKTRGIGTGATRGGIINKLSMVGFASVGKGDKYSITELGKKLIENVDPRLSDVMMTARWEEILHKMAETGGGDEVMFMYNEISNFVKDIVSKVKADPIVMEYKDEQYEKPEQLDFSGPNGEKLYMIMKKTTGQYFAVSIDDREKPTKEDPKGKAKVVIEIDPVTKSPISRYPILPYKGPNGETLYKIPKKKKPGEEKNKQEFLAASLDNKISEGKFAFIAGLDENDKIIERREPSFIDLHCPECKKDGRGDSRLRVYKIKNKEEYFVKCEFNTETSQSCKFSSGYDKMKNEIIIGKPTGIVIDGKELFIDDGRMFKSKDLTIKIWALPFGKKITIEQAKKMIIDGERIGPFTDLVKKDNGGTFTAKLFYDTEKKVFAPEFVDKK